LLLTITLVAALCACGSDEPQAAQSTSPPATAAAALPPELAEGEEWILVDTRGVSGPEDPASYRVVLEFAPGAASGRAPVNTYSAPLEAGDEVIGIGPVTSTEMAGEPAQMAAEDWYFDALQRVDGYTGDGEQLTLLADEQPLLRYGLEGSAAVFGAELVGLKVAKARARAKAEGYGFRVVSVDGESRSATLDYRPDRVNATVVDGRVTEVTTG
jgi:heat shock protein HslJ